MLKNTVSFNIQDSAGSTINYEHYTNAMKLYIAIECFLSKPSAIKSCTFNIIHDDKQLFYLDGVYAIIGSNWDPSAFTEKRYKTKILSLTELEEKITQLIDKEKLSIYIRQPCGRQLAYDTRQSIYTLVESIKMLEPEYCKIVQTGTQARLQRFYGK